MIKIAARLWALDARLQHCLAPIFHKIHNFSGLKTDNGFIAGISTMTHSTYDFEKLRSLTDDLLKKQQQTKVLFAYSGRDHLIETEISEEFSRAIGGPVLGQNGRISIFFTKERHFLQKHQGSFMAKCVLAYVENDDSTTH
uniref:FIST_C domain-containing protein n=1 Tax=Globodera pallida TaxID=36090 RepID=A0A183C3R8_GLOPA